MYSVLKSLNGVKLVLNGDIEPSKVEIESSNTSGLWFQLFLFVFPKKGDVDPKR